MKSAVETLESALESGIEQIEIDAKLVEARALAQQYDQVLANLAAMPNKVLSKLAADSPQLAQAVQAARGRQARDRNARRSATRRLESTSAAMLLDKFRLSSSHSATDK